MKQPTWHPRQDEHPAVRVARDLRGIADSWSDLTDALAGGGVAHGERIKRTPSRPLPIREDVSDLMREVSEWTWFLARVLCDETDWQPPADHATPVLLRALALRVGHFTEGHDLAEAVEDESAGWRVKITGVLEPTGARWVRTRVPCQESDTDDQGQRVKCEGEYRVLLVPGKDDLGDMVCHRDKTHRLTPLDWQRAQRRRMTPQQVEDHLRAALSGRVEA